MSTGLRMWPDSQIGLMTHNGLPTYHENKYELKQTLFFSVNYTVQVPAKEWEQLHLNKTELFRAMLKSRNELYFIPSIRQYRLVNVYAKELEQLLLNKTSLFRDILYILRIIFRCARVTSN